MNDVMEIVRAPATSPVSATSATKSWLRAVEATSSIESQPARLLADVVHGWSAISPARPALLSDREIFSYRQLSERINRYSRWALSQGVRSGDTVCLLMPNRPEYLAAWLGITQVGAVVALINVNLVGPSLAHCIAIAQAHHIIVDADLKATFASAENHFDGSLKVWTHGADGANRLDVLLYGLSGAPLSAMERGNVSVGDRALLIFTSGTTGLPKAAFVSHRRLMNWAGWFAGLMDVRPEDRMYNCLPIYHSVGGCVATGSLFHAGASVFIAERFSARRFWDDVVRHDCTLFQYIGELCRYLLNAEPNVHESQHKLRLCCGNGMRGDVWEAFQSRFGIPQILEFYASTEGNFSLYNVEGKAGAVGRVPSFLAHRFPAAIVRFDIATGLPLRDANGFCMRCDPDETGEVLGRIGSADKAGGQFEGYTSATETEKKVLRNVFAAGDAWFRTGDLMTRDRKGFFYFKDRIGDTFRWKGENVATSEVGMAISAFPGVLEACVYGVEIPGMDGRAGMAAIVAADGFDLAGLHEHLTASLPDYACPVFLRLQTKLEITETFKQKKQELIEQGFDPGAMSDAIWVRRSRPAGYVTLDPDHYNQIVSGRIRL